MAVNVRSVFILLIRTNTLDAGLDNMFAVIITISIFSRAQKATLFVIVIGFYLHYIEYIEHNIIVDAICPSEYCCHIKIIWLLYLLIFTVYDASASYQLYFKSTTRVNNNYIKYIEK